MNRIIRIGCISYALNGVTLVSLGALLPEFLTHYTSNYTAGGLVIFVLFLSTLAGVLAMPAITRRFTRRIAVITGLMMMTSILLMFFLPPWPLVVLLFGIVGFGEGLAESTIGMIILLAVKEKQAIAFSKLEASFGIGALLMPFVASFLIAAGLWTYSFLILGFGALLLMFSWLKLSFGSINDMLDRRESKRATVENRPTYSKKALPVVIAFIVFFFLYVGCEMALVQFFPSIFIEIWDVDSSTATYSVTIFWTAMVVGRIFAGAISEKITYYRYLWISCIGGLLVLVAFVFAGQTWSGFALSFVLGLFLAGLFGIALVYANGLLPGMTERTTSLLLAAAGLGGAVVPLAAGWTMDRFLPQVTFALCAATMVAILAIILASPSLGRRAAKVESR